MSPIPSLFPVSKPATQGGTEPLSGAQGDPSNAFTAFLALFGPDVDPAFAQPGQPLGKGLEDTDVPEVTDTAALTQLAGAPIDTQGDGSSIPPAQLLDGNSADHITGAPAGDDIAPADTPDNLAGEILSGGEAMGAGAGTAPKSTDLVPIAADSARAAPAIEASYQVPPPNGGRSGEPLQTQRPGGTLLPEQAQPHGPAADAAGLKERHPHPEGGQATRPAPDSAGRDPLKGLMEANRPERTEQMLLKAGPQPVDTPDLMAQTPGAAESMALRQGSLLPSAKVILTPQQSPAQGIAVQIAHAAQGGVSRFEIRLDPPDLGRIEVRLEMTQDGRSSAHLLVERAETLDLLQRDARALERALHNAGLDTSEGGLKFSLKDQGLARHSAQQAETAGNTDDSSHEDEDLMPVGPRRWINAAEGGLDIRV